jgi:hypothetical protein
MLRLAAIDEAEAIEAHGVACARSVIKDRA